MDVKSGDIFNTYVIPKCPISTTAQHITGIVWNGSDMTVHGRPLPALSIGTALLEFCDWLQKRQNVFLISHNGRKFDFPILVTSFISVGKLENFFQCTAGLIDSLPLFRKYFPEQTSYKQEDLVSKLLHTSYGAHNATEDVSMLQKLLVFSSLPSKAVLSFSFTPKALYHSVWFNQAKVKNLPSLNVLVYSGVCKNPTAENIAGSGLTLFHLRKIYQRDGEDGLLNTFTVKNTENQPRVTSTKRVLDTLVPKLAEFFSNEKSDI